MTDWRPIKSAGAVALLVLCSACSELLVDGAITITLQEAAPWPTQLRIGQIANIEITALDSEGRSVGGLHVDWQVSDSSVVSLSDLALPAVATGSSSANSVSLSAVAVGEGVTITARASGPGLDAAQYSVPVEVVSQWPEVLAVTQRDTLSLEVDPSAGPLSVEWSSSDDGVLRVADVGGVESELTALRQGTAEVTATVSGGTSTEQFRLTVSVASLLVEPVGDWPDTLRTEGTSTVNVTVQGLDSAGAPSSVSWRSGNVAVFEVTSQDGLEAEITGRGRGSAELIAEVDLPGFERAEARRTVVVAQGWLSVSAGGWIAGEVGTGGRADHDLGHTCAISTSEDVYCWGSGSYGQLGVGSQGSETHLTRPTRVPTLLNFQSVTAGGAHTCALSNPPGTTGDGQVYCWGSNGQGELGDGTTVRRTFPTLATAVGPVWELQAGVEYTCATENVLFLGDSSPELVCWGRFSESPQRPGPVAEGLTAGAFHACVEVGCTGWSWAGQGGMDPLSDGVVLPYSFGPGFGAGRGTAAGADHTCQVEGGALGCFGSNEYGQLGVATSQTCDIASGLTQLGAYGGPNYAAFDGLFPAGGLYTTNFKPTPSPSDLPCSWSRVDVPGPAFVEVTAGFGFSCARTVEGEAYCWGRNDLGQLGIGAAGAPVLAPTPVAGGLRFTSLDAGLVHVCGVTIDRAIYCWGGNADGQVGNGERGGRLGGPEPGAVAPALAMEPPTSG